MFLNLNVFWLELLIIPKVWIVTKAVNVMKVRQRNEFVKCTKWKTENCFENGKVFFIKTFNKF